MRENICSISQWDFKCLVSIFQISIRDSYSEWLPIHPWPPLLLLQTSQKCENILKTTLHTTKAIVPLQSQQDMITLSEHRRIFYSIKQTIYETQPSLVSYNSWQANKMKQTTMKTHQRNEFSGQDFHSFPIPKAAGTGSGTGPVRWSAGWLIWGLWDSWISLSIRNFPRS